MIGPAASVEDGSPGEDRTSGGQTKGAVLAGETLDLRGLRCPMPVLKVAKRLAAMTPGARVEIVCDDPLAAIDLPVFCRQEGQRLVETGAAGPAGATRYLVERGEQPPRLGRS